MSDVKDDTNSAVLWLCICGTGKSSSAALQLPNVTVVLRAVAAAVVSSDPVRLTGTSAVRSITC